MGPRARGSWGRGVLWVGGLVESWTLSPGRRESIGTETQSVPPGGRALAAPPQVGVDAAGVARVRSAGCRTRGAQNTKQVAGRGEAAQRGILTAGARGPRHPRRAAA